MSAVRARLWRGVGRHAFRWTPHLAYGLRRRILRLFGASITGSTKFRRSVRIDCPWNLTAGALTVFGDAAILRGADSITIGERCVVSQHAMLSTEMRQPGAAGRPRTTAPIRIEDDCWIATDTLVLPGAVVHAGTVVGARALVEGELPGWSIAVGEPARVLGERTVAAASHGDAPGPGSMS